MTSCAVGLRCWMCRACYPIARERLLCDCGAPLEVAYDLELVDAGAILAPTGSSTGVWRFHPLLPPVPIRDQLSLGEGNTPLIPLRTTGRRLGVDLFVKDEAQNPTGSFKARGAAVAVSMLAHLGWDQMSLPTVGNGGSAWAAYCARRGVNLDVEIPAGCPVPPRGLVEPLVYGASVRRPHLDAPDSSPPAGYLRAGAFAEPYRVEGDKTFLYEVVADLKRAPDHIVWPTSGGVGIVALARAHQELMTCGVLHDASPLSIVAVQHRDGDPFVVAINDGITYPTTRDDTVAGMAAGIWPGAGKFADYVVDRVRASSRPYGVSVSDTELQDAISTAACQDGFLFGPEGASSLAAVPHLLDHGVVQPGDCVVVVNTGSAHRYPESLLQHIPRKATS